MKDISGIPYILILFGTSALLLNEFIVPFGRVATLISASFSVAGFILLIFSRLKIP